MSLCYGLEWYIPGACFYFWISQSYRYLWVLFLIFTTIILTICKRIKSFINFSWESACKNFSQSKPKECFSNKLTHFPQEKRKKQLNKSIAQTQKLSVNVLFFHFSFLSQKDARFPTLYKKKKKWFSAHYSSVSFNESRSFSDLSNTTHF